MKSAAAVIAIVVGAVLGSLGVARTDPSVEGWVSTYQVHTAMALGGLALLGAGIVLLRSGRGGDEGLVSGSLARAVAALEEAVGGVNGLGARLEGIDDPAALHRDVDALVTGPVARFVENRQAITDTHGIGAYAAVMGPFAQGERYLNRAWSASTDRHLQEAATCVRRAAPALDEALGELRRLAG